MNSSPPIIDLRPDHWEIVLEILQRRLPSRHVFAFGSRATWTAKDYSDLDLAIMGEQPVPLSVLSALNEEFVESDLPFRVDIVDFASLDDNFRAIIQQHGVPVQSPRDVISSTIHVSKKELKTVQKLIEKHLPNTEAWVYGNRLKGESNRKSDLNIIVFSTPERQQEVSDLRNAFDESELSFHINLLVSEEGSDGFHKEIKKGYFVFINGEKKRKISNWRDVSVGEIANIVGGGTPSTKDADNFDGTVPWLTPKDLSGTHERYIRRGKRNLSQKGLDSSSAKLLPKNSVLLSTRAPIGYVALAKNPIATNQGFRSLIVRDDVVPEFLYYWLKSNTQELERHASGSTFLELSRSALREISIKIAPVPEQRKIAHILGTLDDKIELNRRMNATLEAMARAIFKSWFVNFDPVRAKMEGRDTGLPKHIADLFPGRLVESEMGEIPKGWDIFRLDQLASHYTKPTSPSRSPEEEYEHFSIPAYDAGRLPSVEMGASIRSNKTFVRKDAVLLSKLNPRIPRVWMPVESKGRMQVCSTEFLVFTPLPPSNRSLLFTLFVDHSFRSLLESMVTGTSTSHQRVSPKALKTQVVLAGSPRVFRVFDEMVGSMLAKILNNRSEATILATVRDTLLPKLISGRIPLSVNE